MTRSRWKVFLLVLVAWLVVSIPASAQVTANGFSFSTTFVISKVDDNGRILLTLFGFFANGPGAMMIDVKCPLTEPQSILSTACVEVIEVGTELYASSGTPPETTSDYPTRYALRSITIGTPVIASLSGSAESFGVTPSRLRPDAVGITRPRSYGELRSVIAA